MGVQGLEEFWKRSSWRESWSRGAEVSGGSVSLARLEKNGVAVWSLSGSGPTPALGTCAAGRRRRRAGGPRPPSSPSSPAPPAGSHSSVPAGEPVSGHLWARRWQRRRPRPRGWTCAPPTPRGGRRLGVGSGAGARGPDVTARRRASRRASRPGSQVRDEAGRLAVRAGLRGPGRRAVPRCWTRRRVRAARAGSRPAFPEGSGPRRTAGLRGALRGTSQRAPPPGRALRPSHRAVPYCHLFPRR